MSLDLPRRKALDSVFSLSFFRHLHAPHPTRGGRTTAGQPPSPFSKSYSQFWPLRPPTRRAPIPPLLSLPQRFASGVRSPWLLSFRRIAATLCPKKYVFYFLAGARDPASRVATKLRFSVTNMVGRRCRAVDFFCTPERPGHSAGFEPASRSGFVALNAQRGGNLTGL